MVLDPELVGRVRDGDMFRRLQPNSVRILIRNQQVTRSSRVAGSTFHSKFNLIASRSVLEKLTRVTPGERFHETEE